MNIRELIANVQRGEDSRNQFKVDVTSPDALAAEVVAFLNADGGTIFIGVDDVGTLVGLDADGVRRINQMVSNVASQCIKNPVALVTENVVLENRRIVVALHVPCGMDKPYFDKSGVIWLKEGADKRKVASKEEIRRLFEASASLHADEQPTRAGLEELDLLRFRPFFEKIYNAPFPVYGGELLRIVRNMNLATDDGKLNLAGLMMFGLHPDFIVPQFCIKAVRINGTDMSFTSFQDSETFSGTISEMYDGAMAFVMRNMRKVQKSESVNLPGESEIPRTVFEEIIVNALVHRNYYIDAPIRILMFDNRVEVISPGSLPNHLTVEKILAGNTNIRNPIIASFVARGLLPYWGLGSGIRRAKTAWNGIEFVDDRSCVQFKVVISFVKQDTDANRIKACDPNELNRDPNREPNSSAEALFEPNRLDCILELLRKDAGMTIPDLAVVSGMSIATVKRAIAELKRCGLLKRVGGTRGRWEVVSHS